MKTEDIASAGRIRFNNNWFLVETRTLRNKQSEPSNRNNSCSSNNSPSAAATNTLQISSQISTPAPNQLQISHFVCFQGWVIETISIFHPEYYNQQQGISAQKDPLENASCHNNLMIEENLEESIDQKYQKVLKSQQKLQNNEFQQFMQENNGQTQKLHSQMNCKNNFDKRDLSIEENQQINQQIKRIRAQKNQSNGQQVDENNQNQQLGTSALNLENMLDQFRSSQLAANQTSNHDKECTINSDLAIRSKSSTALIAGKQSERGDNNNNSNSIPAFSFDNNSKPQCNSEFRSKNTSIQTEDSRSPDKKQNFFFSPGLLPLLQSQLSQTPQSNPSSYSNGQISFPLIHLQSLRQIPTQCEVASPGPSGILKTNNLFNELESCSEGSSLIEFDETWKGKNDVLQVKKSISKSSPKSQRQLQKANSAKYGSSSSPKLFSETSIKRDRKNLVKNFIKAFRSFLNEPAEEPEVMSILGEKATQLSVIRKQFEKFVLGKNFNNSLMVALLQNKEFSVILTHFLKTKARDWITVSKIKDKLSHYEALDHYLLSLVDSKALAKVRCLKYRSINSMDDFFQ